MRIIINESLEDESDIADLLREIAGQIDKGMQRGYSPSWEIISDDAHITKGRFIPFFDRQGKSEGHNCMQHAYCEKCGLNVSE